MVLKKIAGVFGGDPHKREIEKLSEIVDVINSFEAEYEALSDEQLKAKTDEFKARLEDGETLDDLLPEAFAVVREAGKRTIGLRHYDIQMIGGMT
ncbi:MAG: accessory Sec system translocase SecA2, partial [Anaerolineaceae bacterium]|nr:accessory Sec system translocase SecA2 [Anaerolineaceae bacterium]